MPKSVQLSIPDPCHEDWDAMKPREQGRHCSACQKTVIDFSLMSDDEVRNYFLRSAAQTCGRFAPHQLDRALTAPKRSMVHHWKYVWNVIVSTFLLAGTGAHAQSKPTLPLQGLIAVKEPPPVEKKKKPVENVTKERKGRISGVVVDNHQIPVSFASIQIKGVQGGVATDERGRFDLKGTGFIDSLVITVSALGHATKDVSITSQQAARELTIILQPEIPVMTEVEIIAYGRTMGKMTGMVGGVRMVKVDAVSSKPKRAWKAFTDILAPKTVRCYPNPVNSGQSVTVELSLPVSGDYTMDVITTDGKILAVQSLQISSPKQVVSVETNPAWSKGVYWLRITGRNTKKVYQSKIVLR